MVILVSNILPYFKTKKIKPDPKTELENYVFGKANYYKINCPECFEYNGSIKETNESQKID